jgi:hypothetical protein
MIMRSFLTIAIVVVTTAAQAGELIIPKFTEEAASAGISSTYAGDWEYMVGGGAAAFDCNDDGFPDLFLAGGEAPAKFYRNRAGRGGLLRFTVEKSGLELDKATGAYPLDIDADGDMDLVVLRLGENVVMRGLGNCRFERANERWSFDGGDAWSTSLAATWEKAAHWPTIAIGNYVDHHEEMEPWGTCTDNWLHRPSREGGDPQKGFAPPEALKPSFCPLSMLFTDWDRSGTPSLRVSNDREYYEGGQEQLWRMKPGEKPALFTESEGWKYLRIWGMGIASYDLDFDGYPEYFLTSMADNKLQTLAALSTDGKPKPDYKDVAYAKGVTAHRPYMGDDLKPSTAWHTQFEDVNNDGRVDLFIVKGNVAKMPDFAGKDPNNLLLQEKDGKFREAGNLADVSSTKVGRGGALVDFNLDGLLDMVVVNRWENAELWRNTSTSTGNWLQVRLRQDGPNRDAIGAWIEVRNDGKVMRREITVGGGHAGGQLGWLHFGLGQETSTEIRILWPGGTSGPWAKVDANRFYTLDQNNPPRLWEPR